MGSSIISESSAALIACLRCMSPVELDRSLSVDDLMSEILEMAVPDNPDEDGSAHGLLGGGGLGCLG